MLHYTTRKWTQFLSLNESIFKIAIRVGTHLYLYTQITHMREVQPGS